MKLAAGPGALEPALLDAVSFDAGWSLLERFSTLVRESGSGDEHAAAEYIAAELARLGVPFEMHEPDIYLSLPRESSVEWAGGSARAKPPSFAVPTPEGGLEAELAYVPAAAATGQRDLFAKRLAVRALAMRLDEQTLSLTGVARGGEALPGADAGLTAGGAYRLNVASAAPVVVSFEVRGRVERIPLFVAGGRAEQTVAREVEEPWLLRVEGVVTATLSSVPGLLRLSRGGALSFARVADFVILALLLAGAIWTWRNARVRRGKAGPGP